MRDSARQGIAIGFFDGVHPGHREILDRASEAITFLNHPLSVLAPERAPKLLMSADARIAEIGRALGGGKVTALEFTPELAACEAEEFARRHFVASGPVGGARVVCGEGWRFGAGGRGNAELLRAMGIRVEEVPQVVSQGIRISSTAIREAMSEGHLERAVQLLGRPYEVVGKVRCGKGLGRQLGFPTVNLDIGDVPLRHGVYAVSFSGGNAIANYGFAPTCGDSAWKSPVLEIHCPSAADVRSNREDSVTVRFGRFIREERVFASLGELRRQIAEDIARAGLC